MTIQRDDFGFFKDQKVELFLLSNNNGLTVEVMNYGAAITSISIPGEHREERQIACGFDTFDEYQAAAYKANAPYFRCSVGRHTARINDGLFSINGVNYKVARNDGSNHLHGGIKAFVKKMWFAGEPGNKTRTS